MQRRYVTTKRRNRNPTSQPTVDGTRWECLRKTTLPELGPLAPQPKGLKILGSDPRTGTYIAIGPLSDWTLIADILWQMVSVRHTKPIKN